MSLVVFPPLQFSGKVWEGLVLIFLQVFGRIHQWNHLVLDFCFFGRILITHSDFPLFWYKNKYIDKHKKYTHKQISLTYPSKSRSALQGNTITGIGIKTWTSLAGGLYSASHNKKRTNCKIWGQDFIWFIQHHPQHTIGLSSVPTQHLFKNWVNE